MRSEYSDSRVILTDCDGVLLNWGYAFFVWMERHGNTPVVNDPGLYYSIGKVFGMEKDETKHWIKMFNESAAIGFLPPFRDSIHYVDRLHREHGYVFHVISSLSTDPDAGELRTRNLKKLFGETVFEKFTYLDTGADKHEALAKYHGKGHFFVEDKTENALLAYDYGLRGILVEHGHNMDHPDIPTFKNWKEIYEHVTGSKV